MSAGRSPLRRRAVFLAAMALPVILGVTAQFRGYAGPDTGFLLDEAARVLRGDRPYVDLVDLNPPLTLALNLTAVQLAWRVSISEIMAYQLACTAGLLAALVLAVWVLRRLLTDELVLRRATALLLAFALFALPGRDFGEREHLLLALVVPYVLLTAARAAGRKVPTAEALLIGFLAASAFALKPHFVLLWLGFEGYLRLTRRVSRGSLLPETMAIAGFLALYTLAILLWMPEYPRLLRLLAGPYTQFLHVPFWELLVRGPGALLTVLALLAFAALRRHARHPEILGAFALGAAVCLVAGAAQRKGFGYHFYPSTALATVVLGLLVLDGGELLRDWVGRVYRVIATASFITVVLVGCVRIAGAAIRPTLDLEQQHMERLLPVVRARAAGEGVYVMSYNISSAYPLINYAGAHSASRFAQLWMLPAAYMDQLEGNAPLRYRAPGQMSASERYLNQAVLEDLRDRRPKLLIILQHARDLPANGFRRLDYVAYFGRDPRIAGILRRYQLAADMGDFLVYELIPDGAVRSSRAPGVRAGTQDIVPFRQEAGANDGFRVPDLVLVLLAFVVSAIFATIMEKSRTDARVTPESA